MKRFNSKKNKLIDELQIHSLLEFRLKKCLFSIKTKRLKNPIGELKNNVSNQRILPYEINFNVTLQTNVLAINH